MSCHGRKQRCFTVYTHTASLNFPEELAVKSGGNSFGLKSVVISCRHSFDPVTSNGKNSQLCLFLICDLLFGGPPSSYPRRVYFSKNFPYFNRSSQGPTPGVTHTVQASHILCGVACVIAMWLFFFVLSVKLD